jgi:hypothetical protein
MSTNSRIGIENSDGTVSSVYCHWDGYPSHNGIILMEHYQDREKVQKLINLGSLSLLDERVEPDVNETHSFDKPIQGITIAYHRDRQESYEGPRVDKDLKSYAKSDIQEYGYVYTLKGVWKVCKFSDRKLVKVSDLL